MTHAARAHTLPAPNFFFLLSTYTKSDHAHPYFDAEKLVKMRFMWVIASPGPKQFDYFAAFEKGAK